MSAIRLKYSVDGSISTMFNKTVRKAWINFKNLLPEDIEAIKSFAKPIVRDTELAMSTDKPSTWDAPYTAQIVKTLEYLQSTHRYIMPSVEDMMGELKFALKTTVSKEDMQNFNQTTDELWMDFIKRLDDPEMQSLVKSISPYYMGDSTYGWKLCLNNAMAIKKAMPEATFVKTFKQWQDDYNRKIKDGETPMVIKIPNDSVVHKVKDVMQQAGYGNDKRYGDLARQQKDYVDVKTRSGNASHYNYVKVFDISQTYLPDGAEDIFNNTVGFKNNLTGELNDLAIQDKIKNGYASKEAVNAIYHNENGNPILITKALYNGISQNYPDIKVYCPKDNAHEEDFERAFQDMVIKLADKLIEEKAKIVKSENRQVGIKSTLTAVLILTRLNAQKVAIDIANNDFSPKFYFELRDIINEIISIINKNLPRQENKNMMNEMQIPYIQSVEELMSMLGVDDSMENMEESYNKKKEKMNQIKESFYNTLNRI